MKRITSFLLVLAMLISFVPTTVFAAEDVSVGGTCGESLAWEYTYSDSTLTISGTGEMADYHNLEIPWFDLDATISHVVVEEGVTSISDYAFFMMASIESVYLSSTVESIGESTFYCCTSLEKFTVADGSAYFSTDDEGVLYDANKTELVCYPLGSEIVEFTLPYTVYMINPRAFVSAQHLESFAVTSQNYSYKVQDGVLYSHDLSTLIAFPAQKNVSSYAIPSGTVVVNAFAFENCGQIESVTIPDTVKTIGSLAFCGTGITTLDLPDSVLTIQNQAFSGCADLTSVTLPQNLTDIVSEVFYGCASLETVTIPASVTYIDASAFDMCGDFTIYGVSGSYAEDFAAEMGIPFVAQEPPAVAAGYKINVTYDDTLCDVTLKNQSSGAAVENGGYIYDTTGAGYASLSFTISNIAEGYRLKSCIVGGNDVSDILIEGSYGKMAAQIREDTDIVIELEKIPAELPTVNGVGLYLDYACTNPITSKSITITEDTRIYAGVEFDGGESGFYSGCYFEYSTDGVTWIPTTFWGDRTDFWFGWPGWDNYDFDFINTQDYYLRVHAFEKEHYSTGEAYSEVITINPSKTEDGDGSGSVAPDNVAQGTISFAEDAYLDGKLIVSVWANGQTTGEYLKQQFTVTSLEDIPFAFRFSGEETAVSIRVMLECYSGKTNLYTNTATGLDFVLTENGMDPEIGPYDAYIDINKLSNTPIVMPTGKIISGSIIAEDYQAVGTEVLMISFGGDLWTRAFVDPKTQEYTALMPYGMNAGSYYASIEKSIESAKSNILPGVYYPNGVSTEVQIDPSEDLTGLNFHVDIGYALAGTIRLPDDAVIENFALTCELMFNDSLYYVTGTLLQEDFSDTLREIPYMVGVDRTVVEDSNTIVELNVSGWTADDMLGDTSYSNLYCGSYYYAKAGTTCSKAEADEVSLVTNVSGIDFDLQTGAEFEIEMKAPGYTSRIYATVWFQAENGDVLKKVEYIRIEDGSSNLSVVLPKSLLGEKVYVRYKLDYDTDGEYPDLYTGKGYICEDGSVAAFREDATLYTIGESNRISFTLAKDSEVAIPETVESNGVKMESAHPYASNTSGTYTYQYEGAVRASGLKVTFSPKSWVYDYLSATIELTDGNGETTSYTVEEFNELISGEEITIDGTEFSFRFSTPYVGSYSKDYGFAIVNVEPIPSTAQGNTCFLVKDTTTLEAMANVRFKLTSADGTVERSVTTDSSGAAYTDLPEGVYSVQVYKDGYQMRNFVIEKTEEDAEFDVYMSRNDILSVDTTVSEMTREEMENAGIDLDAVGNQQVYNCTAVIRLSPTQSVTLDYICTDNTVLKYEPAKVDNTVIYPASKDIYLIIHSNVTWLKEMFDVQLLVANSSAIETVENCVANLQIPEGLSLAVMAEEAQSASVTLGDVLPLESAEHHWYLSGDKEGEYYLNGTVTGTRIGGGISEEIAVSFATKDAISVLAGSALKLTIEAEKTAVVGEPYRVQYTLQNVSDKTLYNVALNILGGKFFKTYSVTDLQYDPEKTYGGNVTGDTENGYALSAESLASGSKLSGIFEITFAQGIDTEYIEYMVTDMFTITGNGSTTTVPTEIKLVDEVIKHNWDDGTVTKAATCTEDGVRTYTCTDSGCGETKTEIIPATGHSMSDWSIETAATCTDAGKRTRTCANCDYAEDESIPALGHDFSEAWTVDEEATCTTDGSKSRHCSRCDAKTDETVIPASGHSMSEWSVTAEADCTNAGEQYRECTVCDYDETEVIPALGHDFSEEWTVDQAETCTTDGSKSRHCSRCDAKTDETVIPASGHSMSEWSVTAEADCTTAGEKRRDCANCDHFETEVIPANGHEWDNGVVETPATETSEGKMVYSCKNCDATKDEVIPKLVKQELEFARIGDITVTYGAFKYVDNPAYNDSEDGSELTFTSSNEEVGTVNEKGRVTILNAGETVITATAAATEKYIETSISYRLTVNKAELTVTPVNAEIRYAEIPTLTEYAVVGFVNDEDEAVLTGTAVLTTDYEQYDSVGTYAIKASGLTARNYNITFTNGTLTVSKADHYQITLGNLVQRKDDTTAVTAVIEPQDSSAVIKVEYQVGGVWGEAIPSEIGEYKVRASLVSSDNINVKAGAYAEAVLTVKAGAVIDLDGNSGVAIDTVVDGNKAEFKISDEDVKTIIDNIPSSGEVVIDAKGSTDGVNDLTIPSNIVDALSESEKAKELTILADAAEITMDSDVLATVADKAQGNSKVSIHIEGVDKEDLNGKQQAALESLGGDDAVILQLNLVVTHFDADGNEIGEDVHALGGDVDVRAAFTLPNDMIGKRVLVCYVADDGSVSYIRAKYEDGFVSFKTDHFSHYVLTAVACPHSWDEGTVITAATTTTTGLMRYTCVLCDETKDEVIPKKSSGGGGGGGGGSSTTNYTVKFETSGGSAVVSQQIEKGQTAVVPTVPTKDGFAFGGWFTDRGLTAEYDFDSKVTKDITLYAKWIEISEEEEIVFSDVADSDWFSAAVEYVSANQLMNGVSESEFAPTRTLTRAMLVTILYRNEGAPENTADSSFTDVERGSWYEDAVIWANANGIVQGYSESVFGPNDSITREQIAVILYRYAQYKGYDVSVGETAELSAFADSDDISDYAVDAIRYAVGSGLINGKSANTIAPKDNATRAEIAAILQRFIEANK